VALSSTEAKLIAVDEAVRELRYLHKLLHDFGIHDNTILTTIKQDNQSTMTLINSTHFNTRTKHISLRYHHVGEQMRAGAAKVEYMPTEDMTADLLTKPLPSATHGKHTETLLRMR